LGDVAVYGVELDVPASLIEVVEPGSLNEPGMSPPVTTPVARFSLRVFELVHLAPQRLGLSLRSDSVSARATASAPVSDTASASALHA